MPALSFKPSISQENLVSSENKTGEKYNNTVFVSWGFKNDKLAWEWAIYNAANSPKPYKQ